MDTDKFTDSARSLQSPGDELRRHDLAIWFISHPCELLVFQAQEDVCDTDVDCEELVKSWWDDLPGYIKYSNTTPERARSRYEANHIRIYAAMGGAK